jgi:arylsulfatase A-like enzyme
MPPKPLADFRLILLILATLLPGCDTPKETPPNFVIIYADDLGYGDIGSFGAEQIRTPHLDKMADDGLRFTSLYSVSPVCSPSRAGLLTGRYPIRSGIHGVFFPESWSGIDPEEITIAEAFKTAGYATGHVGKWHLGHRRQFLPLQNGFDEYFGIPYSNDMAGVVYLRGNDVEEWTVDQHYTTKRYTEESLSFIERHRDEPFFLYLAHSMPHVPIYASPEFEGKSPGGLYGDVIEEIDWSVGQVLAKLDELDLAENTLVIFTSDNGPWLVMEDLGGSAGILREGKQFTFEGGMRVPAIARWPGQIAAGSTYDGLVTMMDWFPTFLNLASVPLPADRPIDGLDIRSVLDGTGTRSAETLAYYMNGQLRAFRSGDWKVKLPFAGTAGSKGQLRVAPHDTLLFNLRTDPGEQLDLSETQPQELDRLMAEMADFKQSLGPVAPRKNVRNNADESHYRYLEQKHSAGY